jgi:hypothetical protein
MIKYALICAEGHQFEDWFDNMADYDQKKENNSLACPVCGSTHVQKAIMAPRVSASNAAATPCGASADALPSCAGSCPALQ